jgi:tetratricopeptide (TPR) repeat protein
MPKKLILIAVVSLIYLFTLATLAKKFTADVFHVSSQANLKNSRIQKSLVRANDAIGLNPLEPEYYRQRAKIFIVLNEKEQALADLATAYNLNPQNAATIRDSIPLYFFLASKDLSKPASPENIDEEYIQIAQSYLEKVKQQYPNDVGVQITVAKYEKRLNLEENRSQTLHEIEHLRPDLLEWHPDLLES